MGKQLDGLSGGIADEENPDSLGSSRAIDRKESGVESGAEPEGDVAAWLRPERGWHGYKDG